MAGEQGCVFWEDWDENFEGNGVFCFGFHAVYENTLPAAVTVAVAWRLVGISRLVGSDS